MPRRDAPRDGDAAESRPKPRGVSDQRAGDGDDDWLSKAGDDTGELDVGPPVDHEPSTTVSPMPVRPRPATSRGEASEPREREASRRQISTFSAGAAIQDATRAEVNPLLGGKPAPSKPQMGRALVASNTEAVPEASREMNRPNGRLLDVLQDEEEPATSVEALPPRRARQDSGGATDEPPTNPLAQAPQLPVRSSTRGEVSISEISKAAQPGGRKGTRGVIPIVSTVEPESSPKRSVVPQRSSTRGDMPITRPSGGPGPSAMLRPSTGPDGMASTEKERGLARPPSNGGSAAAAEKRPPPPVATRIEDEVTGPTHEAPRLPPRAAASTGVEDEHTSPIAERPTTPPVPRRVEAPAPAPRPGARPMLSQQQTGQFHASALTPVTQPAPPVLEKKAEKGRDAPPVEEEVPTEPRPAPKPAAKPISGKKKAAGGAMAGLKKLAQTGMHLLPGKGGGVKDLLQRTGLMRLSQIQSLTGLHRLGHGRSGFQIAVAGVMLVLGLGLVVHVVFGKDVPPEETLQYLYPYGFTGGVQPNGRMAPPASAVHFKYTGTVDCGANLCDHFDVDGSDSSFHITMTVTKHDDGSWALVGGPPVR